LFVIVYLTLAEIGKSRFYALQERKGAPSLARPMSGHRRTVQKRASRWYRIDRPRPQLSEGSKGIVRSTA
jgi:hypothetical protein